jgi:transcriptional regulator with XRE-family HTH domain
MAKPTLLSKRILELRKEQKMTQGDLAQKVGVSTTAISQFEKGSSRPSLDTLAKLSIALGEDISALYPHIGEYPISTGVDNTIVPIAFGKHNQPKWEYLLRNESAWPEWAKQQEDPLPYPIITLPPQLLEEGKHRVFPMGVRSMEPTFAWGDLLLFTLLEQDTWGSINLDSTDQSVVDQFPVYAVEVWSKTLRYLPIGRLAISSDSQSLICHYDDRSSPTIIPVDEVHKIWLFRWHFSTRFLNPLLSIQDRIKELEQKLSQKDDLIAHLLLQIPKNHPA